MSEFRGFVFDIDRTAVPNGAQSVESIALRAAFTELPEDIIAIAATGRAPEITLPLTRNLKLLHESVVANGALVIHSQTGKVMWQRLLSEKQSGQIIEICKPYDYQLYFGGDGLSTRRTAREQVARAIASAYLKDVPAESAHAILEELRGLDGVDVYLSPAWGGAVNTFDLNIGHREAKKHNALLWLYDKYELQSSDMIGIGDGINDIELFSVVGHKVAVANAEATLLKQADEVVASQEKDGLADVVRRFHR